MALCNLSRTDNASKIMMLYHNAHPTRRRTLGLLSCAALFAASGRRDVATASAATTGEIAPGIFVHQGAHDIVRKENSGDIANTSFIVGRDSVAVIDTGACAKLGASLLDAVRAATNKPVRYVINTHMHPDHVLGNAAFVSQTTELVAHHKLARGLAARSEFYLRRARETLGEDLFDGTKIVLPTQPIAEKASLDLGNRKLTLIPRATAHTDNDLTIFDETTGTLFTGDLLFSGHVPTLDGSILGWLKLIETLKGEPAARVVPGHGPPSLPWPDAILPEELYLRTIVDEVRAAIKAGKTIAETSETAAQSEKPNWQVFEEHHIRNVTAAFAELEWE